MQALPARRRRTELKLCRRLLCPGCVQVEHRISLSTTFPSSLRTRPSFVFASACSDSRHEVSLIVRRLAETSGLLSDGDGCSVTRTGGDTVIPHKARR